MTEAKRKLERRLERAMFKYLLRVGEVEGSFDIDYSLDDKVFEVKKDGSISADTENIRRSHLDANVEFQ